MTSVVNQIIGSADYFVLLLFRVGGLVLTSPVFGRINIPARVKIGLVAALSFLFFTVFPQTEEIQYSTLSGLLIICAGELLLGIALAFVTNIFFAMTFVAGQLIDMQIGFGIVNVYDPQNNTQVPMVGNILNLLMLIVFFTVDGHQQLINIIYLTIERMPVGTLVLSPGVGLAALEVFARAFLLGVMVALPIIASGLTLEIVLGVVMRMVPQIHMFVVGMPLKLIIGLVVFMVSLPVFVNFSSAIFSEMFDGIGKMFSMFLEAS
ncbi:MAG: flagellar biosynthetic protein FliR [Oscillospiraceae bacterium]|jgi:flagellar biosynthetic protein FliR|nr:flagellar biosynthetic protein FliR [Oscillospiraceae bacterium]